MNSIGFWGTENEYGEFSNFYPCNFKIGDIEFNCSEQAFMYFKANYFKDDEIARQILSETDPKIIKKLGRKVKNFDELKWNKYRKLVMFNVNYAKFSKNPELKAKLLSTENDYLYENSPYDDIWGVGKDGKGQNLLGEILMLVRNRLRRMDSKKEEL